MKHPFTGIALIYYLLAWAVLIAAHALVLTIQYDLASQVAIADSLLFNLLLGGFGFILWWAIQFVTPKYQGVIGTIISFAILILLGASVITFAGDSIMDLFYGSAAEYNDFANNAKGWKLLTGSLYLGLVIMVYYLLRHSHNLEEKAAQEAELQTLLKHSELEMLKFQINPHFIFNSLNSISSLTLSEPALAREMVIKLSDFLRGSLGREKTEMHTLEDELEQMNLYLDIEKVRFGDRLSVDLELDSPVKKLRVPTMILQPLYENAIKYGVYEQLETVSIQTKCSVDNGNLSIRVSNNYDSEAVAQKGNGIGLKNIRSRLELIYGIPDLVTIERGRNKFCVRLEIPQKAM